MPSRWAWVVWPIDADVRQVGQAGDSASAIYRKEVTDEEKGSLEVKLHVLL